MSVLPLERNDMETPVASMPTPGPAAGSQPEFSKKRKLEEEGSGCIELTGEDVRKMAEPLSRQQLLDILQEATFRHSDVLEDVRRFVDQDTMHRKIFVRGLGWETNADKLKSVFSRFGDLEEGVVITDKNTGKSRGFGFVTFKHMDGALTALKDPSKPIDGRMTFSQLATAGPPPTQPSQDVAMRKIYVGNIPFELPADRLLNFFSQYGEIEEGPLGFDKQTGRSRGFAFFIYKTPEAAKRALEEPAKLIDRYQVLSKLAVEGQKQQPGAMHGQQYDAASLPSMPQAAGNQVAATNLQYSSMPQSITTAGTPFGRPQNSTQAMNTALNSHFNPGLNPSLTVQNQSFGVTSPTSTNVASSNPPYSQGISSGASQTQPSLGAPSYGQLGSYGSQPASSYGSQAASSYGSQAASSYGSQAASSYGSQANYGGQMPAYPGAGAYGATQGPVAPQATAVQSTGLYGQAVSYPTASPASQYGQMGSHGASLQAATQYGQVSLQTTPTQNVSQYAQLASQTTSMQTTGQYVQAPYQSQTLVASAGPRAPTAGISTSMPPYYGA